jgi:hypothetical protein
LQIPFQVDSDFVVARAAIGCAMKQAVVDQRARPRRWPRRRPVLWFVMSSPAEIVVGDAVTGVTAAFPKPAEAHSTQRLVESISAMSMTL